ncbi:histidine kinase dimerization/phospho-acceptor domain-containing protein [Anaeromyxobacter diazotrophicus]|uniref:histidine kinase n=1 Tax=Anaeromyxobacter diazotrophicus TaxID=2590199 RepID=A0A7I9VQR5_9BACT|nr:histidine kinase dimerization/phospho-acceptor domain-containing protein [Anaeromyxobacter diazotrophicus]GEJ58754.1 hypothetical protein AMYX_34950 [Anaeromyxobacter diazotrophicus]
MAPYTTEATSPERRGFMLLLGATNAVLLVLDVLRGPPELGLLLAGRLLLMAVLLGAPLALGRASGAAAGAVATVGGVVAAAGFAAVARATGGGAGPYLVVLPILPIVYLLAVPDVPWAALSTGLLGGTLAIAIVWSEGARGARLATAVALNAFGTAYATAGAALNRHLRRREAAAREELGRSEARRVQAERMTLLGRVVAGVAHAFNNPLAALSADLRWLERVARGAPEPDAAEVDEVAGDARSALERLRRIVLDLGALAREGRGAREALELAELVAHAARLAALRGVAADAAAVPAGLRVLGERDSLVQALAGVLISCSEGGARGGAALRLSAAARDGALELRIDGAGRGVLLHDDVLLVVARERLSSLGGGLEARRDEGGEGIVVHLPPAAAEPPPAR